MRKYNTENQKTPSQIPGWLARLWNPSHEKHWFTWASPRKELFYQGLPTKRIVLPGPPHEKNSFTWASPGTDLGMECFALLICRFSYFVFEIFEWNKLKSCFLCLNYLEDCKERKKQNATHIIKNSIPDSWLAGLAGLWKPSHENNCVTRASPRQELLYLGLPTRRVGLPGPPHEKNCATRASSRKELFYLGLPTRRIALPGPPHEKNCSTWGCPGTEIWDGVFLSEIFHLFFELHCFSLFFMFFYAF